MSGILIRKAVGMMTDDPGKFTKRVVPAVLISFAGLCIALIPLYLNLRPVVLERLLEGVESPYAIIEAYDKWYAALAAASITGMVIVVVCGVAAIIAGRRSAAAVVCAICISAAGILLCGVMYVSEDISALRTKAGEDMAQITEGRLESAQVSFHKEAERSGLPGPYTEGQPVMFAVYRGIGAETGSGWRSYYIPDNLGFTPDKDRLYNENKSIDWNDENAGWYSITYTTNFRVVISVEPLN